MIFTGSDDTHILVYDYQTFTLKKDFNKSLHIANIFHAINRPFTHENEIISCALDGKVNIHNIETGQSSVILSNTGSVYRVAIPRDVFIIFIQNPNIVYCCCESCNVIMSDIRTKSSSNVYSSSGSLYTLNINPMNQNEIMTGGDEGVVVFMDIRYKNYIQKWL